MYIVFIVVIVSISCNNHKRLKDSAIIEVEEEAKINQDEYYLGIIDEAYYIKKIDFLNFKKAKIKTKKVSEIKILNNPLKNKIICDNWDFTNEEFSEFLKGSRFVSKNEMMKLFYWEPCEVEVSLLINGTDYICVFNKGYTGKLIKGDELYYLVNDSVLD